MVLNYLEFLLNPKFFTHSLLFLWTWFLSDYQYRHPSSLFWISVFQNYSQIELPFRESVRGTAFAWRLDGCRLSSQLPNLAKLSAKSFAYLNSHNLNALHVGLAEYSLRFYCSEISFRLQKNQLQIR